MDNGDLTFECKRYSRRNELPLVVGRFHLLTFIESDITGIAELKLYEVLLINDHPVIMLYA